MLRAVVTAADMTMPIVKPQTVMEFEQVGLKFLNELSNSSALGRVWRADATLCQQTPKSLNLDTKAFASVGDSSTGEYALVKEVVENEAGLQLVGKMQRGTHGAWLAKSGDGDRYIFKLVSQEDVRPQLQVAGDSLSAINTSTVRTPQIQRVGFTPDKGSWYIQEFLPGRPAPAPTDKLITGMSNFNEHMVGRGIEGGKNWSEDVMGALYKDSKGWKKNISSSGDEGRFLVQEIERMVERNRFLPVKTADIVHGDFQHYNALVNHRGRLGGYIDWEGAGKGDRGIDLSRLLYDSYVWNGAEKASPVVVQALGNKIASVSGAGARENYMNYWNLQVTNWVLGHNPADAKRVMGVGRQILADLRMSEFKSRKTA